MSAEKTKVLMNKQELKKQKKILDIELLKIYYEEWRFRQENLWKRMISFFIVIFFISTLPVTSPVVARMFENLIGSESFSIPENVQLFFPICGMVLSIFFLWYCVAEAKRIEAVDKLTKKIIKKNFPTEYRKRKFPCKTYQIRMSIWIPFVLTVFEIVAAITMIILIIHEPCYLDVTDEKGVFTKEELEESTYVIRHSDDTYTLVLDGKEFPLDTLLESLNLLIINE